MAGKILRQDKSPEAPNRIRSQRLFDFSFESITYPKQYLHHA
jgi:hypothetical protein